MHFFLSALAIERIFQGNQVAHMNGTVSSQTLAGVRRTIMALSHLRDLLSEINPAFLLKLTFTIYLH